MSEAHFFESSLVVAVGNLALSDAEGEELTTRLGEFLRSVGVDSLADLRFGYGTPDGRTGLL